METTEPEADTKPEQTENSAPTPAVEPEELGSREPKALQSEVETGVKVETQDHSALGETVQPETETLKSDAEPIPGMPRLTVYLKDGDEKSPALSKLKRMKVKFEQKPLRGSPFMADTETYEKTMNESPSPLFCVEFEGGARECTLKINDIKKLVSQGLL